MLQMSGKSGRWDMFISCIRFIFYVIVFHVFIFVLFFNIFLLFLFLFLFYFYFLIFFFSFYFCFYFIFVTLPFHPLMPSMPPASSLVAAPPFSLHILTHFSKYFPFLLATAAAHLNLRSVETGDPGSDSRYPDPLPTAPFEVPMCCFPLPGRRFQREQKLPNHKH